MRDAGLKSLDDVVAFEKTPLSSHNLPGTSYEALKRGAAINPDVPALSYFIEAEDYEKPIVYNYGYFFFKINQTANAMRRLGIGRDDVIAFVLPNLPEAHFTIWGGSAAGKVLGINPLLEPSQITELMAITETKLLVTLAETPDSDIWQKVMEAAREVPSLKTILICDMANPPDPSKSLSHSPATTITIGGRDIPVSSFLSEIESESGDDLTFPPPKPNNISTMLCTGGTTGLPKIACRSHQSEVFDCWAMIEFNPLIGHPDKPFFCGLPLFHANAIILTGLLTFMRGGHVVLATPNGFRDKAVIENFWKIVAHHRIALFSGVPSIYSALLRIPNTGLNLDSMEYGLCGAAPMPVELFNRFVEVTGVPIVELYGLTETVGVTSMNPHHPDGGRRIGSIGIRLPHQQMRCAIFDENDTFTRWAETDEIGVIMILGPNVMERYMLDQHNEKGFAVIDGERWFNTGDLAREDNDGYFWLTGRKKELIIRGGHNIDPKMIEEAMHRHPDIVMAAAVGRPDAYAGELPVLYYESSTGREIPMNEIDEFARANVPERAAIPKDYIRLDKLPVTAVGKLHKVSLNIMEIEQTIRAEAGTLNAKITELEVAQDSKRGVVARLRIEGDDAAMRDALGKYAFTVDFE